MPANPATPRPSPWRCPPYPARPPIHQADAPDAKRFYGVDLVSLDEFKDLDCLIIAVAHKEFKTLTNEDIGKMFKDESNDKKVIVDVKGVRNKDELKNLGYRYWRL